MKLTRLFLAFICLLRMPAHAEPGWPMPPASYFIQRIPAPPTEGDAVDISDLGYVLAVQACATKDQIKHAKLTDQLDPFTIFGEVLGRRFTASKYPLSSDLFTRLSATAEKIKDQLKAHYARKRPIDAHEENGVISYVPRFASFSYPSGHSLRGWLWALVLAGAHYQTDIMASRAWNGSFLKN